MSNCPICNQFMDLITLSFENQPFVDGNFYPKMCFGCAHTPKEDFCYKNLNTASELVENGFVRDLDDAQKCIDAVSLRVRSMKNDIKGMKLPVPEHRYAVNPKFSKLKKSRMIK